MPLSDQQKELLAAYERGATSVLQGASIGFDQNYADGELISKESVLWILEQSYIQILEVTERARNE